MNKYRLRFWFEHGGGGIWGMNDKAKEKYGYSIENDDLPISETLKNEINILENEYATYLDWNCPQNPSQWTEEQKIAFINKATIVYKRLEIELGSNFEIFNEVNQSII